MPKIKKGGEVGTNNIISMIIEGKHTVEVSMSWERKSTASGLKVIEDKNGEKYLAKRFIMFAIVVASKDKSLNLEDLFGRHKRWRFIKPNPFFIDLTNTIKEEAEAKYKNTGFNIQENERIMLSEIQRERTFITPKVCVLRGRAYLAQLKNSNGRN